MIHKYICLVDLSAFDLEREREWRQRENALKVQIAQLEATLKADVGEKGSILDRLTNENGRFHREVCCPCDTCILIDRIRATRLTLSNILNKIGSSTLKRSCISLDVNKTGFIKGTRSPGIYFC